MGWSAQVRSFLRMKIPSSTELNWRESQDRRHQHAPPAGGFWPGVFCRCRWAWGGCWSPGSSAGWSSGPRAQRTAAAWPPTGPGRCPPSAPRSGPASPHLSSAAAPGTAPVEHDTWLASQAQWQFGFRAPSYFPPPPPPSPRSGLASLHLLSAAAPGTAPVEHDTWLVSQAQWQFGLWVPSYHHPPPLCPPPIWFCQPLYVICSCFRCSTCRSQHLATSHVQWKFDFWQAQVNPFPHFVCVCVCETHFHCVCVCVCVCVCDTFSLCVCVCMCVCVCVICCKKERKRERLSVHIWFLYMYINPLPCLPSHSLESSQGFLRICALEMITIIIINKPFVPRFATDSPDLQREWAPLCRRFCRQQSAEQPRQIPPECCWFPYLRQRTKDTVIKWGWDGHSTYTDTDNLFLFFHSFHAK